jgi:hypothetical protein
MSDMKLRNTNSDELLMAYAEGLLSQGEAQQLEHQLLTDPVLATTFLQYNLKWKELVATSENDIPQAKNNEWEQEISTFIGQLRDEDKIVCLHPIKHNYIRVSKETIKIWFAAFVLSLLFLYLLDRLITR